MRYLLLALLWGCCPYGQYYYPYQYPIAYNPFVPLSLSNPGAFQLHVDADNGLAQQWSMMNAQTLQNMEASGQ